MAGLAAGDPRQLGEYWLAGRLGAGGQGVVFEAYGPDGVRVAVKALHAEYVEGHREMLAKEVAALRRVAPFCTARVLAAELEGNPPYVVSEFVAGADLQTVVERQGPFGAEELHRMAVGIVTALTAVHGAGVIHRDLKPANILLGPDGPRVIDFGIARTEEMSRTETGRLKGTPRWMAPEQFRGERAGPEADIWAWALVVLYAAVGRPPFEGDSLPALMHRVLTHDPDPSVLAEPLRSLVGAALSRDPAARPSARDLLLGLVGDAVRPLEAGAREANAGPRSDEIGPSLAERAETVYRGLDAAERELVPQILLRLVAPGTAAEDSLRSGRLGEFAAHPGEQEAVLRIVEEFHRAGVLLVDGEDVALSSAALLRAWPRLSAWVDGERAGLETHRGLVEAARLWESSGRKGGDLPRGTVLNRTLDWAATDRRLLTLNPVETDFLQAGAAATRRRGRIRTGLTGVLAVLLAVAVGASALAIRQTSTVTRQRDRAVANDLAARAVALRKSDPVLARRIAIAAGRLAATPETRSALVTVAHQWEDRVFAPPGAQSSDISAIDDHGRVLALSDHTTVTFWDVDAQKSLGSVRSDVPIFDMSLSGDGTRLVTLDDDHKVTVWDVAAGTPAGPSFVAEGHYPTLDLHGTRVVVRGQSDQKITVWQISTGKMIFSPAGRFVRWTISPNGNVLLLGDDRKLRWFDIDQRKEFSYAPNVIADRAWAYLSISADGKHVAAQGDRKETWVIDISAGKALKFIARESGMPRFTADGTYLAINRTLMPGSLLLTGADAPEIMRYPTDSDRDCPGGVVFGPDEQSFRCFDRYHSMLSIDVSRYLTAKAPQGVQQTVASADGGTLAVQAADGFSIFDLPTEQVRSRVTRDTADVDARSSALSDDGRTLAMNVKGDVELWDTAAGTRRTVLPGAAAGDQITMAFSPDGRGLAIARSVDESDSRTDLWDLSATRLTASVPGYTSRIAFRPDGGAVAFSGGLREEKTVEFPSGRVLSTGADTAAFSAERYAVLNDNDVILHSATTDDPTGPPLRGHRETIVRVAFSHDGTVLATADIAGEIRLWDTSTGRQIGLPLTGQSTKINALVFYRDDSRLFSLTSLGDWYLWSTSPTRVTESLCKLAGPLTRPEWTTHIPTVPYQKTC